MRLGLAFKTFFRILGNQEFADKVEQLSLPVAAPDPAKERARLIGEQLHLLGILQRDGRLLDFLSENLSDYSDDQIGAAVRDIHRDCQKAINKYLELGPIIDKPEDSKVDVPAGFDPSRIRLTGNVKGNAPFKGVLAHRGWLAKEVKLPERTDGADGTVLFPAEVEIS